MLVSLFALAPFFSCLFWTILLLNVPDDKRHSKNILVLFMLCATVLYLTHAFYFSDNKLIYENFDDIYIFVSLSIFPLYYLFMVSTTKESIHQPKYVWHVIPAFFFSFLYGAVSLTLTHKQYDEFTLRFLHATSLSPLSISYRPDQLAIIFLISRAFYLSQIILYVFLGLRLSKNWKRRLEESVSETEGKELRQIEILSGICLFMAIIGFFVDSFGRFFIPNHPLLLLLPAFLFTPLFFKAGLIGYKHNFSVLDLEEDEKYILLEGVEYYEQPSKIRQRLELLMVEKQIYLTPDLRISTLCEELHTNRTYLSQVLNEELKENFNFFINKYRVNHAIELLKNSKWDNYSLDKFAELSGFGSTISMIRAFKLITGKTPSEFRI